MPITSYNLVRNDAGCRVFARASRTSAKYGTTDSVINTASNFNPGQTSVSGSKDTDWRIKISKQQNATLDYTMSKWCYLVPYLISARSSYWSKVGQDTFSGILFRTGVSATNLISPSGDSALMDQALARFKRKLSGSIGNAELMIPAVELKELRRSIRSTAGFASELITSLARARKTRGRSLLRFYQEQWLNFSFGVSPMISDTMKALESVNNYLSRPQNLKRIHASSRKEWLSASRLEQGEYLPGFNLDLNSRLEHSLSYTYSAAVDFGLVCGNNYSLGEHLGFSEIPRRLPALGWELFPFSWVLDYFTTMGAYLSDTFELPPGSTVYLCRSRLYKVRCETVPSFSVYKVADRTSHALMLSKLEPGEWEYVQFVRVGLDQLPHRALRIKSVDEVGRSAVNKLLNLTALLKPGGRSR